jgi:hypothetical protein
MSVPSAMESKSTAIGGVPAAVLNPARSCAKVTTAALADPAEQPSAAATASVRRDRERA